MVSSVASTRSPRPSRLPAPRSSSSTRLATKAPTRSSSRLFARRSRSPSWTALTPSPSVSGPVSAPSMPKATPRRYLLFYVFLRILNELITNFHWNESWLRLFRKVDESVRKVASLKFGGDVLIYTQIVDSLGRLRKQQTCRIPSELIFANIFESIRQFFWKEQQFDRKRHLKQLLNRNRNDGCNYYDSDAKYLYPNCWLSRLRKNSVSDSFWVYIVHPRMISQTKRFHKKFELPFYFCNFISSFLLKNK